MGSKPTNTPVPALLSGEDFFLFMALCLYVHMYGLPTEGSAK